MLKEFVEDMDTNKIICYDFENVMKLKEATKKVYNVIHIAIIKSK